MTRYFVPFLVYSPLPFPIHRAFPLFPVPYEAESTKSVLPWLIKQIVDNEMRWWNTTEIYFPRGIGVRN